MRKNLIKIIPLLTLLAIGQPATYASTANSTVIGSSDSFALGGGYASDTDMPAANCFMADAPTLTGSEKTIVNLDDKIDSKKVLEVLRIKNANHMGPMVFVGQDNLFNFYRALLEGKYTQTFVYTTRIDFKSEIYNAPGNSNEVAPLNGIGKSNQYNAVKFRQVCGDRYITKRDESGLVYVAVQFNFLNQEAENKFDDQLTLTDKKKLSSLVKRLKSHADEFKDLSASMNIYGLQQGGDEVKFSQNLSSNGKTCYFNDLEDCTTVMDKLATYSTTDFPSQFIIDKKAPVPLQAVSLSFASKPYTDYADLTVGPSELTPEIIKARDNLASHLDDMAAKLTRANFLLDLPKNNFLYGDFDGKLKQTINSIDTNMTNLKEAGKSCFEDLATCEDTSKDTIGALIPVSDEALQLPESFQVEEELSSEDEDQQLWVIDPDQSKALNLQASGMPTGSFEIFRGIQTTPEIKDKYILDVTFFGRNEIEIEKKLFGDKTGKVIARYTGTRDMEIDYPTFKGTVEYYDPANPSFPIKTGSWTARYNVNKI